MSRLVIRDDGDPPARPGFPHKMAGALALLAAPFAILWAYNGCKIEIDTGYQAVLIRRAGLDLGRDQELAPLARMAPRITRGCRPKALTEGS